MPKDENIYGLPDKKDVAFHAEVNESVPIGDDIQIKLWMKNNSNEVRKVESTITIKAAFYTGIVSKDVKEPRRERVILKGGQGCMLTFGKLGNYQLYSQRRRVVGVVVFSNHKVRGSNPGELNICLTFFSAKVDSAIHSFMSTSCCWGLSCDRLLVRPGGVNDFHTETRNRR